MHSCHVFKKPQGSNTLPLPPSVKNLGTWGEAPTFITAPGLRLPGSTPRHKYTHPAQQQQQSSSLLALQLGQQALQPLLLLSRLLLHNSHLHILGWTAVISN